MDIEFVSFKEEVFESQAGEEYTAYELKGIKTFDSSEWSKKIFRNNYETIGLVENLNPGDIVKISFDRSKFRNITDVEVIKPVAGSKDMEGTPGNPPPVVVGGEGFSNKQVALLAAAHVVDDADLVYDVATSFMSWLDETEGPTF